MLFRGGFAEILCKPKILPLKSAVLEQLQQLEEQNAADAPIENNEDEEERIAGGYDEKQQKEYDDRRGFGRK